MSASAVEIVESDVGETAVLFVKERARRYSEDIDDDDLNEDNPPLIPEDIHEAAEEGDDTSALISDQKSKARRDALLKSQTPVDKEKYTSSIGGASFNFINSIVGSGIIGIPSALQQSGFMLGVILLVFVAVITDYTIILLIKDGILANKFSYQEMVTEAFGRPGYWFLTFAQFLFPFFAMSGYVVIVGDTIGRIIISIIKNSLDLEVPAILSDPRSIIVKVAAVVLVMMPISMFRNISRLEKISAFAIVCIIFICTVIVYELFKSFCTVRCFQPDCCDDITSWFVNKQAIEGIGIMSAAFVAHHNTYLIYGSLKNRSLKRFSAVSHISISVSMVFCTVLGLAGFLTFINETQGDLLNNYCDSDPVANATRFFFACVVTLTYPIECFVAREVLEIAISKLPDRAVTWIPVKIIRKAAQKFVYAPRHKSLPRHIVLTLFIVTMTLLIAMTTNDLGVLLAFNGCFTAIPLAFIIPTASFLKLSKTRWYSPGKIIAFFVLIFGIATMLIGTGLAVYEAVESYRNEGGLYDPKYCAAQDRNASISSLCCQVFNATQNFSLPVPLCDCTKQCMNNSVFDELSYGDACVL